MLVRPTKFQPASSRMQLRHKKRLTEKPNHTPALSDPDIPACWLRTKGLTVRYESTNQFHSSEIPPIDLSAGRDRAVYLAVAPMGRGDQAKRPPHTRPYRHGHAEPRLDERFS